MTEGHPHRLTEMEHRRAFERYWRSRGIDVSGSIEELSQGNFMAYSLRSDLVLRVPTQYHDRVHGDPADIKPVSLRKW